MRFPAARAALACVIICASPAAYGLMGEPREYGDWTTQEWPQHGQSAEHWKLYRPDFVVAPSRNSTGGVFVPTSWRTDAPGAYSGKLTTQYWEPVSKDGYGYAFGMRNIKFGDTDLAAADIFLIPDGGRHELFTTICPAIGSLMVLDQSPEIISEPGMTRLAALFFGSQHCRYNLVVGVAFIWKELLRSGQSPSGFPLSDYTPGGINQTVFSAAGDIAGYDRISEDENIDRYLPTSLAYTTTNDIILTTSNLNYGTFKDICGKDRACYSTSSPDRCSPSFIYGLRRLSYGFFNFTLGWGLDLSDGEAVCGDVPAGTPEPANPIREYRTITAPVVYRDELMIIGAALNFEKNYYVSYDVGALLAFDPKTGGDPLWVFRISGELIMPDPLILGNLIVFGTNRGRAFALNRNGQIVWATSEAGRLTFQTAPYTSPALQEEVKLYGPATDLSGNYVYFGGSDGKVHRFDVGSGSRLSSDTLNYYRSCERDANGLQIIKPCPIRCAPAVAGNEFLAVKSSTENMESQRYSCPFNYDLHDNGSYVSVLRLPDLIRNTGMSPSSANCCVDPDTGEFVCSGNRYGSVPMGSGVTVSFDTVRMVNLISEPGKNFLLNDEMKTDTGGVSIAEGFVLAGNAGGQAVGIPSCRSLEQLLAGSSPVELQPSPYPPPPPLGPIRVYPNPYDPAQAANGALKFINLPAGSRIVIYTLAYEEVAVLYESGNRAEWLGLNAGGQEVASGVYLYKIFTPAGIPSETGRIALVRR